MGRTVAAAFTAAIACAALAAPANAGILTASASSCDGSTVTQPFARFGDNAYYKQIGNFESGTSGWTPSRPGCSWWATRCAASTRCTRRA